MKVALAVSYLVLAVVVLLLVVAAIQGDLMARVGLGIGLASLVPALVALRLR